ncbi:group III truncated hemoglobin [Streptodolium elevatio]|uniref:Group III truncated hemoglobin n=1 Tax=Streptodolium elevatio TaxID=3157996 RepID=A0ABV3DLM1_9ACTN
MPAQPRHGESVSHDDPAVRRPDIETREDIILLLEDFYAAAFADDALGHIFVEVAQMDLEAHLPRLADFWEVTLLRSGEYRGNALEPHRALHTQFPLSAEHFERWMRLWTDAVEARHSGPTTRRAVAQAGRVAAAMRKRLQIADSPAAWADGPDGRPELPLSTRR